LEVHWSQIAPLELIPWCCLELELPFGSFLKLAESFLVFVGQRCNWCCWVRVLKCINQFACSGCGCVLGGGRAWHFHLFYIPRKCVCNAFTGGLVDVNAIASVVVHGRANDYPWTACGAHIPRASGNLCTSTPPNGVWLKSKSPGNWA